MSRRLALAVVLLLAVPAAAVELPPLAFEKYELGNGLEVILHEDHSTPVVAIDIWYHVGSKNERRGRTGFAHLFEHMMFQGSKHQDGEYFKVVQEAGGSLNGSTNTDRTNYWEVVPSNFLERALWLEADRMGYLLDTLTQAKLDNQRDVVKNERRQRYENAPYGRVLEVLAESIFPDEHPYSWLTIGSQEDLSAATLDDVKDFFRRFYTPNNATLVVAGDFQPAEARRLIERYFAGLKPGPPVAQLARWVPRIEGERRVTVEDRVQLPRLYLVWHTVPVFDADDAALDVLAQVLGQGKASRLYESLVYRDQIAQESDASHFSRQISGQFQVTATARPGTDLARLEKALLAEVERITSEGPTAVELEQARNTIEADFVHGLEQVGGFSGIADRLNFYNHYLGDPGGFQGDIDRYAAVTAADVKRVAARYLGRDRLVLTARPQGDPKPATTGIAADLDRSRMPGAAADPALRLPPLQRATLGNGLELVVVEHHEQPVLQLDLVVDAGSSADPARLPGLASLTTSLLDEGTQTRKALDIARELAAIGSTLELSTDADASDATLWTLKRHAPKALAIFADVLTRPSFPPEEVERVKKQVLTRLLQERDQPSAVAGKALARVLYGPEHPYGHTDIGTEEGLGAITVDDVRSFYRARYRPGAATLVMVGDIKLDEARQLATAAFGSWSGGGADAIKMPEAPRRGERTVYLIERAGAEQSVVQVAQVGLPRSSADYFPALVLNAALGGSFSSRLNLNLREDKGYTYGARSSFDFRRSPGPFVAGAPVQTKVTKESLAEILRELGEVRSGRPLSAEELAFAKSYLMRLQPQRFETPTQIAQRVREMVLYGLPDDFFTRYQERIQAVTIDDVQRVARERLQPDTAAIVVVGDPAQVRSGLEELGIGKVVELSLDGTKTAAVER